MIIRLLQIFFLLALSFGLNANACTLFSATGGRVAEGGTIIAKNRDYNQNCWTYMEPVIPKHGYRYLSLSSYKKGKIKRGKAGVNEKGLVVVTASTSILPKEMRQGPGGLTSRLLRKCASVDEAIAHKSEMEGLRPNFYLLADARSSALIEIAPGGKVVIQKIEEGVLAHTNHYLSDQLQEFNLKNYPGSTIRLNRVRQLLKNTPDLTVQDFELATQDRAAGPDDSLFRIGSKNYRTLATLIVLLPLDGPPQLKLKLYNQNENEKSTDLLLDQRFWQQLNNFDSFPAKPRGRLPYDFPQAAALIQSTPALPRSD
jgi:isopenicillin-N N-acyltransferase-like protein